jgi:serine/threonine protein kinase
VDLLTQMMQLEPSKRITVKGALAHPFFNSVRDDIEMQDDEMD